MSIDVTFKPLTETIAIGNAAAAQIVGASQRGVSTFRIRNIAAGGTTVYLSWGRTSAVPAPPANGPGLASPLMNTIGLAGNVTANLEVPPDSFFICSVAFVAGTSGVEITGGSGGSGA
jgi:hypothetical protein